MPVGRGDGRRLLPETEALHVRRLCSSDLYARCRHSPLIEMGRCLRRLPPARSACVGEAARRSEEGRLAGDQLPCFQLRP